MPTPTLPAITDLTRPFWNAAAEGRLLLPRCNACGQHFFRPEVACTHCFATDWQWVPASGRGTLYSHTVVHRAPAPGFAVPFVLALVELAEGPVMFSNLVGCDEADVRIGMALRVRFERVAVGVWLPRFEANRRSLNPRPCPAASRSP
ncbi:Zn-ribbon domain-containing OB-fold protein [Aquincola sp. S2]|uniref:Zn-ribbon domain-containing OB-fold protein n=1 Tax=Pseudaquabacterium terrae TaxID=2732868 RepID=A0ABX2ETZ4_9BURK|nr:Zn-ribbon domain-containing OB-fold protein [Aquabacterium terrae]NRF72014.1 Zn-ribbon domain-containing OB-fold protein [Aquabacterium terrae]